MSQIFNIYKRNEIVAMTSAQLADISSQYERAVGTIDISDFFSPRQEMTIEEGIATIHVTGGLANKAPRIHSIFGNTTYEQINAEIYAANAAEVDAIILNIDSGGGSVSGLHEVAEAIRASSAPTFAHCDSLACSAAYRIAASTSHIWATPSANVGNIGVVSAIYAGSNDDYLVLTNDGADLKGAGWNGVSESQKQFMQDRVNKLGDEFRAEVKSQRPEISEEVFRAGWYYGSEAVELGLVDSIGSLNELKQEIKYHVYK